MFLLFPALILGFGVRCGRWFQKWWAEAEFPEIYLQFPRFLKAFVCVLQRFDFMKKSQFIQMGSAKWTCKSPQDVVVLQGDGLCMLIWGRPYHISLGTARFLQRKARYYSNAKPSLSAPDQSFAFSKLPLWDMIWPALQLLCQGYAKFVSCLWTLRSDYLAIFYYRGFHVLASIVFHFFHHAWKGGEFLVF